MVVPEQPRDDEVRELLRAARAGDARAFGELVQRFMRSIYAVAYRLMGNHDDADDIAQETFVRAHAALARYDENYSFYTWLRTIATRLGLNEIEKRRRRQTSGGETFESAAETVHAAAPDPAEELAGEELRAALESALRALPAEYRAVLALRTFEDLSYEDIARVLEIPIGTVMSRLSRARTELKSRLRARTGES